MASPTSSAKPKRVAVLGSTGSIGSQTLDVASRFPDRIQIVGLAARTGGNKLREQMLAWPDARVALFDDEAAKALGIPGGMSAMIDLVASPELDMVVVSVAGVIGLEPTLAAIHAGKDIALASKEVLVAAGEIVMPLVEEKNISLTPIDSEHSAIFQCIQGYRRDQLKRVVLTASGGPFRGKSRADLAAISPDQALNHPTWKMGGKITIDSATLMNKGLEVIEAKWLFSLEADEVDVVIHPQSIIHSFVELADGSFLAQAGWPDMRLPIQIALLHPERIEGGGLEPWSPVGTPILNFEPVDHATFPAIQLAKDSLRAGRTTPCAFNAANEHAANAFLRGEVDFLGITEVVQDVVSKHTPCEPTLENLLETDAWARATAAESMRKRKLS